MVHAGDGWGNFRFMEMGLQVKVGRCGKWYQSGNEFMGSSELGGLPEVDDWLSRIRFLVTHPWKGPRAVCAVTITTKGKQCCERLASTAPRFDSSAIPYSINLENKGQHQG